MSVQYEKGTAAWDIGIILTRHDTSYVPTDRPACARSLELERTAGQPDAEQRLALALLTECTCGKGDSTAEMSSVR